MDDWLVNHGQFRRQGLGPRCLTRLEVWSAGLVGGIESGVSQAGTNSCQHLVHRRRPTHSLSPHTGPGASRSRSAAPHTHGPPPPGHDGARRARAHRVRACGHHAGRLGRAAAVPPLRAGRCRRRGGGPRDRPRDRPIGGCHEGLLDGKIQYRVPLFQRTYSWNERNWEQLWDDLLEVYDANPRPPEPLAPAD